MELERSLGFRIVMFTRISGGGAMNFKAVRESDGLPFLVKCFVPDRQASYARLVANLKTMRGEKVPVRLFEDTCPATFAGCFLLCLSWCLGEPSGPQLLSSAEWSAFLREYQTFADRMQFSTAVNVVDLSLAKWRKLAFDLCRGLAGRILRPALDSMIDVDLSFDQSIFSIVHGDFHSGNVLFKNSAVASFIDLENFAYGFGPTDIARYCYISAQRLARSDKRGLRLILERFAQAIFELPYSALEWRLFSNELALSIVRHRTKNFRRLGICSALKTVAALRFFDSFRRQIIRYAPYAGQNCDKARLKASHLD